MGEVKKNKKISNNSSKYDGDIETMRQELEKYKLVFKHSPEAIVILDKKGNILDINKRLQDWLGYKPDEVIGNNLLKLPFLSKMSKVEVMKKFAARMLGKKVPPYELEFITKSGEKRIGLIQASPVKDANGKIIQDLVMISDITDRKLTEKEIKKLSFIVEQSVDGMVITDLEAKIVYANNAFTKMHGYSLQEMLGLKLEKLHNPEQIRSFREIINQIKIKGLLADGHEHLRRDGAPFPILSSISILKDEEEKPIGIFEICRDITEKKETEEVIKKFREIDKVKDEFLNVAAHELKTPLTCIIGMSEVVKKQQHNLTIGQQSSINIIYEEAFRLKRVIGQILKVTRFESNKTIIEKEPFNLADFIKSILPTLNIIAKKSESEIDIKLEDKKIKLISDKEKINEVIYNLVDNAIKYGPKKQTITLQITRPEKDKIKIEVIDQGKGIPVSLQKKVFVKFGQLEPSLSRTQEGTGLGLYICKLIIEQLGGQIGVKSEEGKGSTFYFTLPIK